ncbi:MAG: desulfoferrodoxin family protein, partial [Candidatus Omnitrophica bacterium]|nr:desulfoferrodoxin family protein [Candidatus Omnitrophota bacterium]
EQADILKVASDKNQMTELEKKHTPMIIVVKSCGLIPELCIDVHVKIGEIIHPMTSQHLIQTLDFYLDKNFLSRVILTPEKLNPAAGMHLKANSGTLTVISSCNLHGKWIKDTML